VVSGVTVDGFSGVHSTDSVLHAPKLVADGPTIPRSDRRVRIGRVSKPSRCSARARFVVLGGRTVATLLTTGFQSQRA
jgi:hypothetical protein